MTVIHRHQWGILGTLIITATLTACSSGVSSRNVYTAPPQAAATTESDPTENEPPANTEQDLHADVNTETTGSPEVPEPNTPLPEIVSRKTSPKPSPNSTPSPSQKVPDTYTEENLILEKSRQEIPEVYEKIDSLKKYRNTYYAYFNYWTSALTLIIGAIITALEAFWDGVKSKRKKKASILVCAILTSVISGFSIFIKGELEFQNRLTGYMLASEAATNDYRVTVNLALTINTKEEADEIRYAYRKWNETLNALSKEYQDVESRLRT